MYSSFLITQRCLTALSRTLRLMKGRTVSASYACVGNLNRISNVRYFRKALKKGEDTGFSAEWIMEYAEIQNNEVEALKAIYASDFESVKVNAVWNQRPSPKFKIQLRPSSDFENSSIELQVEITMTPTYPRTLPEVRLCHHNALSGRQLEALKQSIDRTARELKGSEMIFEITSNLQNQIDEYARITSEAAPNLEEDRLRRLQLEERKQNERHDEIQREMEAAALQEEQKYDSLVLEELKRTEESDSHADHADDPQSYIVVPESTPGVTTFHHKIGLSQRSSGVGNAPVVFRQVQASLKVTQPFFGTSYIAKPLTPETFQKESETDMALLLTKIEMSSAYWRTASGARKLHELNYELELVRNFHHLGVVPLLDFSIERFKGTEREWVLSLLTPLSQLTPLSDILDSVSTISIKTAQSWAFQILEALESLHKAGIKHKCICPHNVMIHHDPDTGESSVLLNNPHYSYLLYRLNEEHPFESTNSDIVPSWLIGKKAVWTPPEGRAKSGTSDSGVLPSTKWDIWQFGALIVRMLAGKKEMYNFRGDPEAYVRTRGRVWPSALVSFLTGVLQSNPAKRPSALELLTDQFFRASYGSESEIAETSSDQHLAHSTMTLKASNTLQSSASEPQSEPNARGSYGRRKLSNNEEGLFSRYKHDFDEGIVLGRGGFGQVVKARNKLDGRIYAVKKIRATPSTLSHILQEVVLLSRLNHQYVVRYYTVWLEDDVDTNDEDEEQGSKTENAVPTEQRRTSEDLAENNLPVPSIPLTNEDILDAIPSTSLSRFSTHHSLSELDLPSASQDFMSDSGFIEFGFSDSDSFANAIEDEDGEKSSLKNTSVEAGDRGSYKSSRTESRAALVPKTQEEPFLARLSRLSRKTLYIQMEYCENHTLGDLIHQGLCRNQHEYWRLLRQILEALAYIHGEGVIHRDLKPKNIFIDQARNIKIGDFGLARSVAQPMHNYQNSSLASTDKDGGPVPEEDELTTYVGTSLYAAIEITNSSGRRGYNEKVDMYSLGIIFFEMVWGMSTEMERVQGIRRARLSRIELPPKLVNSTKMDVQVDIIRALLNHNPDKRPSATELLQSGVIPVEDRDMTVQEALRNIRDQHVVQQLANALFSRPLISAQQVLYDRTIQSPTVSRKQILHNSKYTTQAGLTAAFIEEKLQAVFRAHGAVDNTIFRSRIFPRSALYNAPTVVELLDTQGTVLQLAHDLTLPHARRLAETVPDYSKAYAFDTVYRMDSRNPGHHPLKHLEVDFDIIAVPGREELTFDDAEAITVMNDSVATVFAGLPERELIIVLGHHDILSATLNHCGLSQPQYHAALSLLTADRRSNMLARSNVSAASMDMLDQFAFREILTRAEERMARLMPLSDRVRRGMAHIKTVADLVVRLSAGPKPPQIYFSPLMHTGTTDFYMNGIIFQLVDGGPLHGSGSPRDTPPPATGSLTSGSVLACGGRYDSLIKLFRNSVLDVRTPLVKAVGFGLSADKLTAIVSQHQIQQIRDQRPLVPPRCQVLVTSFSESTLKTQGLNVVRMLWRSGISADIAREMLSPDDLVAHAIKESVPIAVIVKQMHNLSSSNRTFKPLRVKRLGPNAIPGHGDADLGFSELVPFVQAELGMAAGPAAEPISELLSSGPPSESGVHDTETSPEMASSRTIILNESGKLKGGRKNRWQLEEKSSEAKATFLSELSNAPIVSLDLRDDVIEAIVTVSPHAVEEWKRRVVGLSPNQKAYIMGVQAKLANEAVKSPQMLLFSSKTENVFVYRYD